MDERIEKLAEFMGWHHWETEIWEDYKGEYPVYTIVSSEGHLAVKMDKEESGRVDFYWHPEQFIGDAFMLLDRARELYIHTFETLENEVTLFWDCTIEIKRIDYKGSGKTRQLAICNAVLQLIKQIGETNAS